MAWNIPWVNCPPVSPSKFLPVPRDTCQWGSRKVEEAVMLHKRCSAVAKHACVINIVLVTNPKHGSISYYEGTELYPSQNPQKHSASTRILLCGWSVAVLFI